MFTRSAITQPEVNRLGWNLGHCDYAVCRWLRQILGAIRAKDESLSWPRTRDDANFYSAPLCKRCTIYSNSVTWPCDLDLWPFDLGQWSYMEGHVFNPSTKFEDPTAIRSWVMSSDISHRIPLTGHGRSLGGKISGVKGRPLPISIDTTRKAIECSTTLPLTVFI